MDYRELLRTLKCYNDIELVEFRQDSNNKEFFHATLQCSIIESATSQLACQQWMASFSEATHTNWIIRRTCPNPQKHDYRITYDCQHSAFNKLKNKKRSERDRDKSCGATVKIVVKKINRNTIRNDPLLKRGLNLVITVSFF